MILCWVKLIEETNHQKLQHLDPIQCHNLFSGSFCKGLDSCLNATHKRVHSPLRQHNFYFSKTSGLRESFLFTMVIDRVYSELTNCLALLQELSCYFSSLSVFHCMYVFMFSQWTHFSVASSLWWEQCLLQNVVDDEHESIFLFLMKALQMTTIFIVYRWLAVKLTLVYEACY